MIISVDMQNTNISFAFFQLTQKNFPIYVSTQYLEPNSAFKRGETQR